jgi:hypothetical protein
VTPLQKRIIAGLASAVVIVFLAVGVLAITNKSESTTTTAPVVAVTTTSSTTSTAATTATTATTTTEATTTSSSTTTTGGTTTSSTSTSTTTSLPPSSVLILGSENIDGITFGTDAQTAITDLEDVLGTPDDDTGWLPPVDESGNQVIGPCPGSVIRLVTWGDLMTFYTDGATAWASEGTRHLFAYSYVAFQEDTYGLTTAEGIGLGSSADDLIAAYGDGVEMISDEFGDYYAVDVPAPGSLWGYLDQPGGIVVSINGGAGCGE